MSVYRRRASIRPMTLMPRIAMWALEAIYARSDPQGAEYAWMDLAIDMEELKLGGTPFCGGTTDIEKLFGQVFTGLLMLTISLSPSFLKQDLHRTLLINVERLLCTSSRLGVDRSVWRCLGQYNDPIHTMHQGIVLSSGITHSAASGRYSKTRDSLPSLQIKLASSSPRSPPRTLRV